MKMNKEKTHIVIKWVNPETDRINILDHFGMTYSELMELDEETREEMINNTLDEIKECLILQVNSIRYE